MPTSKKAKQNQLSSPNYLLRVWEQATMSQDGSLQTQASAGLPDTVASPSEYSPHLTKADLEDSLSFMYDKLAHKFQVKLYKSINTLTQKIAALGGWTGMLETKYNELHLAYVDLRKDHKAIIWHCASITNPPWSFWQL